MYPSNLPPHPQAQHSQPLRLESQASEPVGAGGGEGFHDLASVLQYQGGLQEIIPVTLQQGPCCTEVWQERDWGCRVSMVTASHSPSPGTRHMGEKPKPGGPSPVTNLSQLGRGCGTDSP